MSYIFHTIYHTLFRMKKEEKRGSLEEHHKKGLSSVISSVMRHKVTDILAQVLPAAMVVSYFERSFQSNFTNDLATVWFLIPGVSRASEVATSFEPIFTSRGSLDNVFLQYAGVIAFWNRMSCPSSSLYVNCSCVGVNNMLVSVSPTPDISGRFQLGH